MRLDADFTLLWMRRFLLAASVVFLALALLLALALPYHEFDALTYSEWSRLIASHWHLRYSDISDQTYHRPLFYVLQGWLWGLVGVSERAGRLLAFGFALVAVAAIAWLGWGRRRPLLAALAVVLLLATPDVARQVASGLTDLPLAAMVALAGALGLAAAPGKRNAVLLAVASAAAVLAKPTGLVALGGLVLAVLLGSRAGLRERLRFRVVPILAGCGSALVYDELQASYLHEGLMRFLTAGSLGFYRRLAAQSRRPVTLDFGWFGSNLRVLLLFALAYGLVRVAGVRHRVAALASAPAALLLAWFLPWIGTGEDGGAVGSFANGGAAAYAILLTVSLVAAALLTDDRAPSRLELGRMLLWAAPPTLAWIVYGSYQSRLLSAAWPPLVLLMALAAWPAARGLASRAPVAVVVPAAIVLAIMLDNAYQLDGLGKAEWKELRATSFSKWFDRPAMRGLTMPGFADALALTQANIGAGGRVLSPDGRFRFFYLDRATQTYPRGCSDLKSYTVFVLLTDVGTKQYMEQTYHVSAEPSFWAACRDPHLTQLSDGSNGYAVFRVGS